MSIALQLNIIGLIGAMDEEIRLIAEKLEQKQTTVISGISYHEGIFADKRVVLCKSGVGKVNAAVCTQILIDRFHVDAVLFTGVAGGVDPSLSIGDIVISTDCMYHDMDVTALGYDRGIIPFDAHSVFIANEELIQAAYKESKRLFPERTLRGRILSGDQFITDREQVKQLYVQMNGACTEMEGAAVAHVCVIHQIPFVIIRSISDKADGSAHVDFLQFTELASNHSCQLVEAILRSV